MLTPQKFARLQNLGQLIAREVVFAEAGKDLGLLPINSLLGEMEASIGQEPLPEPLAQGMRQARMCVDKIFEGEGFFTPAGLKLFGDWVSWWENALDALSHQSPLPSLPSFPSFSETIPLPLCAEPAIMLDQARDRELLGEFITESWEHLENLEQGLLALEENPLDHETLNSIFRAFHTFKGSAGLLNLGAIHGLAHELESLLDLARHKKLSMTSAVIDLILAGMDTLKKFIGAIGEQWAGQSAPAPIIIPTRDLLARIRAFLQEPSLAKANGAPPLALPSSVAQVENKGAATIKVDAAKLDNLMDLVGELVIAQSMATQGGNLNTISDEALRGNLSRLGRISKELQHTAMSMRMASIRGTFQKMNRLARDLAAKAGKPVRFLTQGEDTELDRTLVEEISDPLLHLIRNAMDHGIENAGLREQRGKAAQGTIQLKAFHQGGNIVVEVSDDGNGLEAARIVAKAVEKNIVASGDGLTEAEVFNLIMAPGFSTAETVTDLSGRGVGMDVVRRNVENLRGKIEIESIAGQGSTFRISLPLTMAIIDGLIVSAGGRRYIVPALSVCEVFRPCPGTIKTVPGRGRMIEARGKFRPLIALCALFGARPVVTYPSVAMVILLESGSHSCCLLVDKLDGKQEVVIKSVGQNFRADGYVAGAAILGDGAVALILDPHALIHPQDAPMKAAA